jgi:hypothetical protein
MHRPIRSHERGSALVLAVLILFAMLGLGLLALRTTTQNIAGSGALRMNKTARFVAEVGLYHAMATMRGEAENLLALRVPFADSTLEIESTGIIRVRTAADGEGAVQNRPVPELLDDGPAALGDLATSGLVPSYRVVIDGFTLVQAAQLVGEEIGAGGGENEGFCLMHFTSTGYVADRPLPTPEELEGADAEARFAEHRVKAAVPLRINNRGLCRQLAGPAAPVAAL